MVAFVCDAHIPSVILAHIPLVILGLDPRIQAPLLQGRGGYHAHDVHDDHPYRPR